MKEEFDPHTGEKWIELNQEEIRMGFMAQCVESLAEIEHCSHTEMFNRLEAADMTEGFILKCYEPLHTQSWENIIQDLLHMLKQKESRK